MSELRFITRDLKVTQGSFTISNINIDLKPGDIMGIMGSSGAGKTTIIRSLIGQAKIISGEIRLGSNYEEKSILSYLGYSPQENALYPFLTLEENIHIFGELYHLEKEDIEKRMKILLARLGLTNAKRKRISQMSGGMQKRADLAVALIHKPDIIILDEPFNGVDISMQKFIWDFLKELAGSGKIVIVSSHMISDIRINCNHFGLIENNVFYNTEQVKNFLEKNNTPDLEGLLQKLFDLSFNRQAQKVK